MRRKAREVAFKFLYSTVFNKEDVSLLNALKINEKLSENDCEFCDFLINTVKENVVEFDKEIEKLSIGFKLNRLFNTDKCALYIGMAELKCSSTDIPIVIDEAVNLASLYSTEKSPDFVNGILSSYAEEVR